jgi:3-phenylpropionate/trans-cinnamate dioxygenase ferredoxin subunit
VSQDSDWIEVCAIDEIDEDDAVTVEHDGRDIAVYRTATGFYATDGICTHAHAVLADGLIMDDVVECPLHQGRFHIPTGKALSAPACDDLRTYPVRERAGRLCVRIGG